MLIGNANPYVHLVPSPFLGLAYTPIVGTRSAAIAVSFLYLSPWIPLGTFSILLVISVIIPCVSSLEDVLNIEEVIFDM